jgi:hypothetical protein
VSDDTLFHITIAGAIGVPLFIFWVEWLQPRLNPDHVMLGSALVVGSFVAWYYIRSEQLAVKGARLIKELEAPRGPDNCGVNGRGKNGA